MSWEVLTMRSRVSFFNRGVSRNLLRRCWPLWIGYFVLLLFTLPVSLAKMTLWDSQQFDAMNRMVLSSGVNMILVSFAMGILPAMVMFSYLYNTRTCGMMNALPIRRETMFGTAVLTGLGPMLLADLVTALLTAALYLGRGVSLAALLKWLLMAVCANLSFYGLAVFCAMLTGSLLILPVVYGTLNLAAWVAEVCLRTILRVLVYGLNSRGEPWLQWLSPLAKLFDAVGVGRPGENGPWQVFGLGWLIGYGLLGLVLLGLSLLLYRRRNMETATDTVAYPVLKPLFRYCMAVGTALVFASVVYSMLLGGSFHGTRAALLVLALLLLGAGLGWYLAEMLIRRTVRVFPGKWKGLAAVCAALALLVAVAELDLTGFERRVPAPEEVRTVTLETRGGQTVTQPENIEKAVRLHQSVVDHKAQHEPDIHGYGRWLTLRYELKNGQTLERTYYLSVYEVDDPTDVLLWEELVNCPELLDQRNELQFPVTAETVYGAGLSCSWFDEDGYEQYQGISLTPEQALDFYYNAVLPDQRAHTLGRIWLLDDDSHRELMSNVSFSMDLRRTAPRADGKAGEDWEYLSVEISMDSEACLRWLREHTELPVMSRAEAEGGLTGEPAEQPVMAR